MENSKQRELVEAASRSSKSMQRLFDTPLDDTHVVVTIPQDVIAGGKAMLHAALFHLIQLLYIELVIPDGSPVIGCGIHGKARS